MFSQEIVASDAFLEMPTSSRELYFQLGMYADDDGFVNPKRIMRMAGASDDDLKVLLSKRFLLPFENGVVVIKHWLIHNMIRKDRYKETVYVEQKKLLKIKENGAYTEVVNQMATICQPIDNQRLPQDRIGKDSIDKHVAKATDSDRNFAYGMLAQIRENMPTFKEPNINHWAEDFEKMRRLDNRSEKEISEVMLWALHDDFWSTNILSPGKLRKQFDRLMAQKQRSVSTQARFEGFLHDGTPVIKIRGVWVLKSDPSVRCDPSYYPEISKDLVFKTREEALAHK